MHRIRTAFALLSLVILASSQPAVSDAKGRPSGGGGKGALQLTAAAVVPGPGDVDADAQITVNVGRGEICFSSVVNNTSGYIQTIAIYQAPSGQTGPMVVRLSPSEIGINQLIGCVPASTDLCRAISRTPSGYYIEIRTTTYPDGALRAQLR
jgi:hypothetical protein